MAQAIVLTPSLVERFWAKVNKDGPLPAHRPELGPCWLWTGPVNKRSGYSQIGAGGKYGKSLLGHRISYVIHKGPIPPGLEIDHLCRVRRCVNPDHLEAVTRKVNIDRGTVAEVNRARWLAVTHCPQDHEYTPENTYRYPNGVRACRECRRAQRRARHAAERNLRLATNDGQEVACATAVGDIQLALEGR